MIVMIESSVGAETTVMRKITASTSTGISSNEKSATHVPFRLADIPTRSVVDPLKFLSAFEPPHTETAPDGSNVMFESAIVEKRAVTVDQAGTDRTVVFSLDTPEMSVSPCDVEDTVVTSPKAPERHKTCQAPETPSNWGRRPQTPAPRGERKWSASRNGPLVSTGFYAKRSIFARGPGRRLT
jgi:hypothetical protein